MARVADSSEAELTGLAAAAVLAAVVAVTPFSAAVLHPVIAYPIAAVALASLVYGRRVLLAVFACVAAGAMTLAVNQNWLYVIVSPLDGVPLTARAPIVFGALTVGSLLLVGPITATLMRRRPALEMTAVVAIGLSVAQVVALASLAQGAGMSLQAYMAQWAEGMFAPLAGLADAEETITEMSRTIAKAWPSLLVTLNGFTAVLTVAGVGFVAIRKRVAAFRFPVVASIDLNPLMVVPGIVGIGLLAAGRLEFGLAPVLDVIGTNLLMIVRWVFFLQGVAVFAALYERAKYGRLTRSLGYVLLGVTEVLVPLVSLTGLADIWLNIRRLPRERQPVEVVEAPSDRD